MQNTPVKLTHQFYSLYHGLQNIMILNVHFRVEKQQSTGPSQTIKMIYVTKLYRDEMCSWKREAIPHSWLLCKKYTRKHFVQLKTIDFNVRRIPLMLRPTNTYYSFGCKKYICKKCHLRNLYWCTAGTCVVCKKIFL